METKIKVQIRHDARTESEWNSSNPVVPKGCMAITSDRGNAFKIGNGSSRWKDLSYNSAKSSDVPSWAKQASKPTYTKSEIGLSNVENKSSSQIRSELTKSNVETAIGGSLNLESLIIGSHAKLSYDTSKDALKISFI